MAEARIDKWMWASRIFKTRTIAAEACKKGRVSINGSQVKPARTVKPGDVIEVRKPPITYSFKVLQAIEKRVGAKLIPEILDMVDNGQIKFNPAVELSYLAREEQQDFLSAMDYAQAAPSLSQAQRIKKLAQEGECTLDAMCEIMNEVKKGELDRVTFKTDSLRKYFPKSYTNKQMEDKIIQLLEQWQKKREKSMER